MHKIILFIFLLGLNSVWAGDWKIISPLPECPEFELEYQFAKEYSIRYKNAPDADYTLYPKKLNDINNLSELTDEIIVYAKNFCPNTYTISLGEETLVCEHPQNEPILSDTYGNLIKDILVHFNSDGTDCNDVIPLITLQSEVSSLTNEQLIKFDKRRSFLKLFVGENDENLIDHFKECGGKRGSRKFIENMILLESKNACLFPAPPGLLPFEKAKELAQEIANDYTNLGIIKLNAKKDDITKRVVSRFLDEILKLQLESLLGPSVSTDELIPTLETVKSVKHENPKLLLDHVKYLAPLDIPLEIIDKAIPAVVSTNFMDVLPKSMDEAAKKELIKTKIIPIVMNDYNKCIEPLKTRINYPSTLSSSQRISQRKSIEKNFCELNPSQCEEEVCGNVKNYLTNRTDISDMQMIQGCVFKSITKALGPTLKQIILSQKDILSEYLDMNDDLINRVSKQATNILLTCTDRKVKQKANISSPKNFQQDIEPLYHIEPNDFIEILNECAALTEELQTKEFISIIVGKIKVVEDLYGTGEVTQLVGLELDKGTITFSKEIINKTIPKCMEIQNFRSIKYTNKGFKKSAINCTPLVEMEAGSVILTKTLEKTLKDFGVENNTTISDQFISCQKAAQFNFNKKLFNPAEKEALTKPEQISSYMATNHEYYQCVKTAILSLSDIGSKSILEKTLNEQGAALLDKKYIERMIPNIQRKLNSCFETELSSIGSWTNFIKSHNEGGVDQLQSKCTEVAVEFALPLIINNEVTAQLDALKDVKLVTQKEIEELNNTLALKTKKLLSIKIPNDLNRPENIYIIEKAYEDFRTKHPNDPDLIEKFVNHYTKIAEPTLLESIGNKIISEVEKMGRPEYSFDNLGKYLTPICIAKYYDQNKAGITALIERIDKSPYKSTQPVHLRKLFVEIIYEGVLRSKRNGRYQEVLDKVKYACEHPDEYKDLKAIVASGLGDDFLLAQIKKTISIEFDRIIEVQCEDDISKLPVKLLIADQNLLCKEKFYSPEDLDAFYHKLMLYTDDKETLAKFHFILSRRLESDELIGRTIANEEFIEKVFYDDKKVLNYLYDNFSNVLANDKTTMEKLTLKIVKQLLQDRGKNSFSEKLLEIQLASTIGANGYKKVITQIKEAPKKTKWKACLSNIGQKVLPKAITRHSLAAFEHIWNYENLKEYLALDRTSEETKSELIQFIYDTTLVPLLSGGDVSIFEQNADMIEGKINTFLEENKVRENPYHNPKKKEVTRCSTNYKLLSFNQSIEEEITEIVNKGITTEGGILLRAITTVPPMLAIPRLPSSK